MYRRIRDLREDADLKQLYLLSNLRTVAMFAEKDKNQ